YGFPCISAPARRQKVHVLVTGSEPPRCARATVELRCLKSQNTLRLMHKTHHNAPRQTREARCRTSRRPEMRVHHRLCMKTRRC
ncbi:hypothetical protein GOODEAATRI_034042, partial [Goodea atripinnis]